MSIAIKIYTIEKKLYEGQADAVTLPGIDGELGVLATHIPLISALKSGRIKIQRQKNKGLLGLDAVRGGREEQKPSVLKDTRLSTGVPNEEMRQTRESLEFIDINGGFVEIQPDSRVVVLAN